MKHQFSCPDCGADDTASFPSVYAAGTRSVSIAGVGINGFGDIGVGSGSAVSQSGLAAFTAPPRRRSELSVLMLGILGGAGAFAAFVGASNCSKAYAGTLYSLVFLGVVCLGLSACGLQAFRRARAYNAEVWPGLIASWEKRWICRRCGSTFVPDPDPPMSPVPTEHLFCNMCGASLREPGHGGRFRCPKCGGLIVA